MKIRRSAVTVTATVMLALGAGLAGPAAPARSSEAVTVTHGGPWCARLAAQHAYWYSYQGATIKVPSGTALLAELQEDGVTGRFLNRACRVLVQENWRHAR